MLSPFCSMFFLNLNLCFYLCEDVNLRIIFKGVAPIPSRKTLTGGWDARCRGVYSTQKKERLYIAIDETKIKVRGEGEVPMGSH